MELTPQTITAIAMLVLAAVVLGLMAMGWIKRSRRDSGLTAPSGSFERTPNTVVGAGLYVATTPEGDALNRLAVKGLGFRSRVHVEVDTPGVLLVGPSKSPILIPAADIISVGRATYTIDRVVERDGLVVLTWRIAPETAVDTYLRLQQTSPDEIIAAISALIPAHEPTGTDA